ncbi:hypothetical protein V8G54_027843 [Vigna mungo]|uniref:Uncharacterized protein n=1 Tax=Vigna mungo TaxID=3915 RepID=A0AAQ3MR60_VIGMU
MQSQVMISFPRNFIVYMTILHINDTWGRQEQTVLLFSSFEQRTFIFQRYVMHRYLPHPIIQNGLRFAKWLRVNGGRNELWYNNDICLVLLAITNCIHLDNPFK